jgi:hypothetical protein
MNKLLILAAFALSTSAIAQQPPENNPDIMVVFDASGSMWGQIDGVTKIEIARDAFAELAIDWDAQGTNVGLIAYGHRRKGDCSDIELVSMPEAGSTARLGRLVNALTPRGKTPLSAAVRLAAENLRFTENAATVVLLSDGRETCSADPCALGAELERLGVDFTAHVIGFGLNDPEARGQLECLANSTGGQYFDARDAGGLAAALGQIGALETSAQPTQETPLQRLPLTVGVLEAEGTFRPAQVSLRATNLDTGKVVLLGSLAGALEVVRGLSTTLPAGNWNIEALSAEGYGAVQVALSGARAEVNVPFAAFPLEFTLLDAGPFLAGIDQTMLLVPNVAIQENAQLTVAMFPAGTRDYSTRMDYHYQFGAEAGAVLVHGFDAPPAPGDYDIVVMTGYDLDNVIWRQTVTYADDVVPEWLGPRNGAAGTQLPVKISGVTDGYARVRLSREGVEYINSWYADLLSENGAFLTLPDEEGVYQLDYRFKNAKGERVALNLGTLTVGPVVLEDDPDAVAPPDAMPSDMPLSDTPLTAEQISNFLQEAQGGLY